MDGMTDWSAWTGRTEEAWDNVTPGKVAALAATLDLAEPPGPPGVLPPGWHWVFFNPYVRRSGLGPDGHPERGGFLPPVPLPRRMWAGGRVRYLAPVPIGATLSRSSEILKVEIKSGKRGQLVFVTVRHRIAVAEQVCIEEEQDIVYRGATAPGAAAPRLESAPYDAAHTEMVTPDPVLLFRYSALTANGHRIHYDRPYAMTEEGYRDLVVHGPLLATMLQNLATKVVGRHPASFSFRGIAPVFVDRPFRVEAGPLDQDLSLYITGPENELCMQASATF